MRILFRSVLLIAIASCAVFWWTSRPGELKSAWAEGLSPDAQAGALVFAAAGCASCHQAPKAPPDAKNILAGGKAFPSDFGTFYAPNISPHPVQGIGSWSFTDFARALQAGVSPDGKHYYPAFPYTAYALMTDQDSLDLYAYMRTLPESDAPNRVHDVKFPFSIRRGIGLWKTVYLPDRLNVPEDDPLYRGTYLAEALAHCAECHTPRTALGGLDRANWMKGAPDPAGTGRIPGITPQQLDWSQSDLVAYFTSGLTPDYDSAGGDMVAVIENLAKLPQQDREALAAYVGALQ